MMTSNKKEISTKTMIIVSGMHRSGTSALTRVLNLCGASISDNLLQPIKGDNDEGFWESQSIMDLHDEILASLGCHWYSLSTVPQAWFSSEEASVYKERLIDLLATEYVDFDLAVVKDPRICKLVPLWESALADMGIKSHYLISVRNPLEIAESLCKRNGFKQNYALSLWLVYIEQLEAYTRGLSRACVHYDDLLTDYRALIKTMNKRFDIQLDGEGDTTRIEVGAFLSKSLRHHCIESTVLNNADNVPDVVKSVYQWLLAESVGSTQSIAFVDVLAELEKQADSDFALYLQNVKSMDKILADRYVQLNELLSCSGTKQHAYVAQLLEQWRVLLENQRCLYDQQLSDLRDSHDEREAALSGKVEELNSLFEDQQQQSEIYQSEIERLSMLLDSKDKALQTKESKIEAQQEEIVELGDAHRDAVNENKALNSEYQSLQKLNAQLSEEVTLAENRLYGLSHTGAWALGARLSHFIRKARVSILGRALLLIKAACSFNLKHYLSFRHRMRLIEESGLFDEKYYLRTYPLIHHSIKTPLEHYLGHGEREGRQPNQVFSPYFYTQQIGSQHNSWHSPLLHYIQEGASSDFNPSPEFSTKDYRKKYKLGDENPLAYFLGSEEYLEQQNSHTQQESQRAYSNPITDPLTLEIQNVLNEIKQLSLQEKIAALSFPETRHPNVSIIVPFFNKLDYTVDCLYSLSKQEYQDYELIVVDDASSEESCQQLKSVRGLHYIRNEDNLGYLKSCNKAVSHSSGDFIVQLNNDTLPLRGWLQHLLETFQRHPNVGVVGSMLLDEQGGIQEAGGIIFNDASGYNYGRGRAANERRFNYCRDVDYCSGASIMIPRSVWDEFGGYDERFAPAYYEDTDFAMQAKTNGYRVLYNPFSRIVHHEGVSSGKSVSSGIKQYQQINKTKFYQKWQQYLQQKPPIPPADGIDDYVRAQTSSGRILWVDATTPTPDKDSGSIDTINFFERAIEDGWGISFMAWDAYRHEGQYTTDLQYMGIECLYGPASTPSDCLYSLTDNYDVIVLSRVTVAKFAYPIVKNLFPQAKIIFNTVDLHFLRYEREQELLRKFPNYKMSARSQKATQQDELFLINNSEATVVVSHTEANILEELSTQGNVKVIPLFRDVVGRVNDYEQRENIGFIGGFQHPPNVDAVKYFVTEVWPSVSEKLNNAKFIIAGSHVTDEILGLASHNVEVRGFIPTVEELFEEVRVMVAPLRYGAGIKGKIVSGLCHGVPQVVTHEAAEGMGLEHNADVMIASDAHKFADYIIHLYSDKAHWNQLSDGATDKANALYSKSVVSAKVSELLNEL